MADEMGHGQRNERPRNCFRRSRQSCVEPLPALLSPCRDNLPTLGHRAANAQTSWRQPRGATQLRSCVTAGLVRSTHPVEGGDPVGTVGGPM